MKTIMRKLRRMFNRPNSEPLSREGAHLNGPTLHHNVDTERADQKLREEYKRRARLISDEVAIYRREHK